MVMWRPKRAFNDPDRYYFYKGFRPSAIIHIGLLSALSSQILDKQEEAVRCKYEKHVILIANTGT